MDTLILCGKDTAFIALPFLLDSVACMLIRACSGQPVLELICLFEVSILDVLYFYWTKLHAYVCIDCFYHGDALGQNLITILPSTVEL